MGQRCFAIKTYQENLKQMKKSQVEIGHISLAIAQNLVLISVALMLAAQR